MKLARRGLRGVGLSRNCQSMARRWLLVLSCSTIVNTSEVSSSQARWGYLEEEGEEKVVEEREGDGSGGGEGGNGGGGGGGRGEGGDGGEEGEEEERRRKGEKEVEKEGKGREASPTKTKWSYTKEVSKV